jgi:hypothetical protein
MTINFNSKIIILRVSVIIILHEIAKPELKDFDEIRYQVFHELKFV